MVRTGVGTEPGGGAQPVQPRHDDVERHEIGPHLVHHVQTLGTIGRGHDLEPFQLEIDPDQLPDDLVVVDNKHPARRARHNSRVGPPGPPRPGFPHFHPLQGTPPRKRVPDHPTGPANVLSVAASTTLRNRHAPVAQGIEQRPPEPCAQVRILPGAPSMRCPKTPSPAETLRSGSSRLCGCARPEAGVCRGLWTRRGRDLGASPQVMSLIRVEQARSSLSSFWPVRSAAADVRLAARAVAAALSRRLQTDEHTSWGDSWIYPVWPSG